MPQHRTHSSATAPKTNAASKSTVRRPLRDVSNAGKSYPKSTAKKLPVKLEERGTKDEPQHPQMGNGGDASLDRLLLIHSDLSSLTNQIDELVVDALKITSKEGMKEVESFANFLSQMQMSLKQWVPRFRKVLSAEPGNMKEKAEIGREGKSMMKNMSSAAESPEQSNWDFLVSPSPLVSWRASCAHEGGKELFLLTPLPRQKDVSVKYQEPSKPALGAIASSSIAPPPAIMDVGEETSSGDLVASIMVQKTPEKVSDRALESECFSPQNLCRKDGYMFIMTPCLKVSPPKSCVLLEPLAEFPRKASLGVHQSTPFVKGIQNSDESQDTESSNSQNSQKMPLTYPQFLGIKLGNNSGNRRRAVDESPCWLRSPPKTCILMEPSDENLQINDPCNSALPDVTNKHHDATGKQEQREPKTTIQRGRCPGEDTLKRELWTKFEAASVRGVQFDVSPLENSSGNRFLDRLEEEVSP
ncbi:OLC1v1014879C1 [Oldenlandia corymbosa var. corymbosa]|uniref:OLC1v1014879C1 n=1 Tax=Oldenlandia corymbosa var. corymbosa TaxID=529605 RepID=A0AAV1E225_OLDCO|nr:OLC1v1014879C1 [Oldenlandia corymbosa var. corymbosa]